MANLGDVALRLPADWSRNKYEDQERVIMIVGHEGGEPDVYLKAEPDAEHQFRWANKANETEITGLFMKGYEFVNKDKWVKRLEHLWAWNAEGRLVYAGLDLMARPKAKWLEDEQKREATTKRAQSDADRDIERMPQGLLSTDEMRPRRRARTLST